MTLPHWAQHGGPFWKGYSGWFLRLRPQYGECWRWGIGHRAGGFYLIELGPLRIGRHFVPRSQR